MNRRVSKLINGYAKLYPSESAPSVVRHLKNMWKKHPERREELRKDLQRALDNPEAVKDAIAKKLLEMSMTQQGEE